MSMTTFAPAGWLAFEFLVEEAGRDDDIRPRRVQRLRELATAIRHVVVTNIKEYLPTPLRWLFTLFLEKKGGHRVELREGDMPFSQALESPPLNRETAARPEESASF